MNIKNLNKKTVTIVLLLIAIGIVSLRLLLSAYTSGDDGYTYMASQAEHGFFVSVWEMVKFQGRFYQLVIYPLAMLPFTFDSVVVVNVFKVITFCFFIVGFYYFCSRLLPARHNFHALGCLSVLLCILETVGGSYNAIHGLPLWFGIGVGTLLFSLGTHIQFIETKNKKFKLITAAVFLFALLTYELLLLYVPLFMFFSLYFYLKNIDSAFSIKKLITEIIDQCGLIVILTIVYLVVYFVFRIFYPGTYVGAQGFSYTNFENFIRPIKIFSLKSVNIFNPIYGNKDFSLMSLVFGLSCSIGLVVSISRSKKEKNDAKLLTLLSISVLILYIFIPNLLFALIERYRYWAAVGVQVYLGSLYSAVAISILLYLILFYVVSNIGAKFRFFALASIVIVFTFSGYLNSKDAENFYKQSNQMSVRWDVAKLTSDTIKQLDFKDQNPILICSNGFIKNTEFPVYFRNEDMIADVVVYWNRFFTRKTGQYTQIVDAKKQGDLSSCTLFLELNYGSGTAKLSSENYEKIIELDSVKSLLDL